MKDTSLKAYEYITNTGLVSKRRAQVYAALHVHGPCTGSELRAATGVVGVWKRLSELERQGVVDVTGKRACQVTGRNALVWKTNRSTPHRLPPKQRKPDHIHNVGSCFGCRALVKQELEKLTSE